VGSAHPGVKVFRQPQLAAKRYFTPQLSQQNLVKARVCILDKRSCTRRRDFTSEGGIRNAINRWTEEGLAHVSLNKFTL
jgi:hypothetical protein